MSLIAPRGALIITAASLSLLCGAALAQPLQGAAAVDARHANFKAMGKAFKGGGEQLKSGAPDLAAIKTAAAEVKDYAGALPAWFPKGSGPETGVKMEAKAVIWTDPQGFAAAVQAYQIQADKLATLSATSTDVAALTAQFKATGKTCGACHDQYREKD